MENEEKVKINMFYLMKHIYMCVYICVCLCAYDIELSHHHHYLTSQFRILSDFHY